LTGVQDERRASEPAGVVLQREHEHPADPPPPRAAVDHDLRHLGPVPGVRAHGEVQLPGADEAQFPVMDGKDDA
jgi:hypothetical protein